MVTGTLYNTVKLQALTNKWMQKKDFSLVHGGNKHS